MGLFNGRSGILIHVRSPDDAPANRRVSVPIWSVPKLLTPRGAGLGNEVFPWAKAYLGARAFGLKESATPWAINRGRFDREFGGLLG